MSVFVLRHWPFLFLALLTFTKRYEIAVPGAIGITIPLSKDGPIDGFHRLQPNAAALPAIAYITTSWKWLALLMMTRLLTQTPNVVSLRHTLS
jgi:hypothetical protein